MIILAAVTINVVVNGGLFGRANEAKFKAEMKAIEEQAKLYVQEKVVETIVAGNYTSTRNSEYRI
jgi:hypothetical protein